MKVEPDYTRMYDSVQEGQNTYSWIYMIYDSNIDQELDKLQYAVLSIINFKPNKLQPISERLS